MDHSCFLPCRLSLLVLVSTFIFSSCAGSTPDNTLEREAALRVHEDTLVAVAPNPSLDTLSDDLASMVAGLDPKKYKNKNITECERLTFNNKVEKDWGLVTKHKIDPITRWLGKNMAKESKDSATLFYPFAGADFLYPHTFFPECRNFILVGLEPIGKLLRCDTMDHAATLSYLEKIRMSLYYSNNLGFFRTESMQKDLNQQGLNGTLPVLAFYIKRTHHLIHRIVYFSLDTAGIPRPCAIDHAPVGYRIDFADSTLAQEQSVYYLSFDLSDGNLKKHPEMLAFVKGFGRQECFLKAASYLMFGAGFSVIRNYLLDNALLILQDDSGIPYRSFKSTKWEVQLFGTYTKTIGMFEHKFQPDLEAAYAALQKPHPVPFRIGYNVKFDETNLVLAKRKD